MRRNINLVAQIAVVFGSLAALLLPGCSPDDKAAVQPNQPTGTTAAPETAAVPETTTTGTLANALALWQAGNKEQAVTEFININWNTTTTLPESSALQRSDAEFNAMDKTAQTQLMTDMLSEIGNIKTLCAHVLAVAPASANSPKYYNAVLQFADMLANQKDSMIPLKNIAEDLKKSAQQALQTQLK
jgi:hypothetical protein